MHTYLPAKAMLGMLSSPCSGSAAQRHRRTARKGGTDAATCRRSWQATRSQIKEMLSWNFLKNSYPTAVQTSLSLVNAEEAQTIPSCAGGTGLP